MITPQLNSQVHPQSHVSAGAIIGDGCSISAGAVVCAGVILGRAVSVGANAVFVEPDVDSKVASARVEDNVRVGANATIYPGVVLASGCLVRPGAVVGRSVPPGAIVEGNPANITGYVDANNQFVQRSSGAVGGSARPVESTAVRGVQVHHFPVIPDLRGSLTVGEFEKQIPFLPRRFFMVFGVPSREVRGEHAHHQCEQFLICVRGSCAVVADDGTERVEVILDAPNVGIYLPAMTWGIQYKYSADALLLVFASHHYDAVDYIRDYAEFLRFVASN